MSGVIQFFRYCVCTYESFSIFSSGAEPGHEKGVVQPGGESACAIEVVHRLAAMSEVLLPPPFFWYCACTCECFFIFTWGEPGHEKGGVHPGGESACDVGVVDRLAMLEVLLPTPSCWSGVDFLLLSSSLDSKMKSGIHTYAFLSSQSF